MVDSDSWQFEFMVMVLAIVVVINCATAVFQVQGIIYTCSRYVH